MGSADAAWLRDFDRTWDTKEEGRHRADALDHVISAAGFAPHAPAWPVEINSRTILEATLIRAAGDIARFTVPRQTKAGWSIHVVLKCGQRVRAHFDDLAGATQAYEAIEEFLLWFTKG